MAVAAAIPVVITTISDSDSTSSSDKYSDSDQALTSSLKMFCSLRAWGGGTENHLRALFIFVSINLCCPASLPRLRRPGSLEEEEEESVQSKILRGKPTRYNLTVPGRQM